MFLTRLKNPHQFWRDKHIITADICQVFVTVIFAHQNTQVMLPDQFWPASV